ncbi:MAG: NAD-dependent epimerase/dehydratase family protein [Candidatus Heimdallarchaeaceae archaeon]
MTILVTGSSGFIGFYVVKELLERKKEPIRLLIRNKNPPAKLMDFDVEFIRGDLHSQETLKEALTGVTTVYHVAAETRENMPAELYSRTNVEGTKNLLNAFIEVGGERFVQTSAVGVYGYKLPNRPITEDYPKLASFPYHRSKLLSEQAVFEKAREHGFFVTAIRPPMVMGPGDLQVAPSIFKFILEGKTIPLINGGTKTKTSFAHVKDVARALVTCGENEKANGQAFNVVSFATTQKNLFDIAGDIAGIAPKYLKIRYEIAYTLGFFSELFSKIRRGGKPKITRRRVNQVGRSRLYDTSKIQDFLGFEPQYDLRTSLTESFLWMKENGLVR